jgi:hypothetical protein
MTKNRNGWKYFLRLFPKYVFYIQKSKCGTEFHFRNIKNHCFVHKSRRQAKSRESSIIYCHVVWSDSRRSFGLYIGFIDHFNTQLVFTLNYCASANLHTSQSTRAHAKSFPARNAFTGRFLVADFSVGYSSAPRLKSSLNGGSFPTVSVLQPTNS